MRDRATDALSRLPSAAVAAAIAVLLVAACTDAGTPDPPTSNSSPPSSTSQTDTPTPSPTATKTETPQERDARLAGEAVVRYWAVVDDLAANPTKGINLLDAVARDQARTQRQIALSTYAAKGWVQSGRASVSDLETSTKDGETFTVSACVDVSKIDFLDAEGASTVNPDRPDRQRFSYMVVKADEQFFVTQDTLKGKPC